jgi:hypothetical protein
LAPEIFFICFPLTQVIDTFFLEVATVELAVAEMTGVADGETDGVGVADGVADGVGLGVGARVGVGVGAGVGFGLQRSHSIPAVFIATPGLPTILYPKADTELVVIID